MVKYDMVLEAFGNSYDIAEVEKKVKEDWLSKERLIKELKDVKIYVKPEDNKAYYVVNEETYSISLS